MASYEVQPLTMSTEVRQLGRGLHGDEGRGRWVVATMREEGEKKMKTGGYYITHTT